MSKNVIIVESPAKVRTIGKYLKGDFEVLATYGHVRDLIPKSGAVEPDKDFLMHYALVPRSQQHVKKISAAVKRAEVLYLATDPDREGEAIAWHVLELLREHKVLKDKKIHRVVFNEITERAITQAIVKPRELSIDLVNAQQARRALDYLVGFHLSPLLWKKIRTGLSAGRVQSPALCMIVQRELEIEAFKPREYWSIEANLQHHKKPFTAKLWRLHGKKQSQFSIVDETTANAAKAHLMAAGDNLYVHQVEKKQRKRQPAAPFTTASLQQEAAHKLRFSAKQTMLIAQQLYEGITIGTEAVGLITYMRTDSVVLAQDAVVDIRDHIEREYGRDNLPDKARTFKTRVRNAQEAHEAIRPTSVQRTPKQINSYLKDDQRLLYDLIWKRTVASQMLHATINTVAAKLRYGAIVESEPPDLFHAVGSTIVVAGFLILYEETAIKTNPDTSNEATATDAQTKLPVLVEGEQVALQAILPKQHFTEPPPRYSEASLIKILEEHGIGRPSTYAQIIHVLQQREYVELLKRYFHPTDVGRLVSNFLTGHFAPYVDYEFTARLEDDLDGVAKGEREWMPLLRDFWGSFSDQIEEKSSVSRSTVAQAQKLGIDPRSKKTIFIRMGRYGPCVQMGEAEDEEKPRFVSLPKHVSMNSVTLEQALEFLKLPRDLGHTTDGELISTNIGRFGPYVKYGKKYVSLGSDDDPYTIGLPRALELIETQRLIEAQREIRIFKEAGISILAGRFGPYITNSKKNVRVPKDKEPSDISLEEAQALLAAAPAAKARSPRSTKGKTKQG